MQNVCSLLTPGYFCLRKYYIPYKSVPHKIGKNIDLFK